VVVVGVCVGTDRFTPALAINKEIDLRFVLAYTPLEFRDTLHMMSEGRARPAPARHRDGRTGRRRCRVRRAR
jgi:threonine dehydrogenase-like Zn-dependent dehydrogenase